MIKDTLKIRILNNLKPAFKTYLIVINNQMQKKEKLEEIKVLFKAIQEKKTCIKIEYQASTNFGSTKSYVKLQRGVEKEKKPFIDWPKYKKYSCKHPANHGSKYANKNYKKYHKKRYISWFHNSYTSLNKGKT